MKLNKKLLLGTTLMMFGSLNASIITENNIAVANAEETTASEKEETTEKKSVTYFTTDQAVFGEPTPVTLQVPKGYSEDNEIIMALQELLNVDKVDENGEVVKDKDGNPVKEYATMGNENNLSVVYYGSVFSESDGAVIMLIVNKTGKVLQEFEVTLELKVAGEVIVPETTFGYRAEDYGALESGKVTPVTIPISSEFKELIENAKPEEVELTVKDYKEVKAQ